jgi:hypothetical protein
MKSQQLQQFPSTLKIVSAHFPSGPIHFHPTINTIVSKANEKLTG